MSAFFLVAYSALSVPAVLAGLAVTRLGLPTTFAIFGVAVAGLALFVALQAWRARPNRASRTVQASDRPAACDREDQERCHLPMAPAIAATIARAYPDGLSRTSSGPRSQTAGRWHPPA
jgi:hypothetical protein